MESLNERMADTMKAGQEAIENQYPGAQHVLAAALNSGNLQVIEELLNQDFDRAATDDFAWIKELAEAGLSKHVIAKMLWELHNDSPWIYHNLEEWPQHNIDKGSHISGCVHEVPSTMHSPSVGWKLRDLSARKHMEALCGIGGISPFSRDKRAWNGSVRFETLERGLALAGVTYAEVKESQEYDADILQRLSNVLTNFCSAAGALQDARLCCDSFTALIQSGGCLQLRRYDLGDVADLNDLVSEAIQSRSEDKMRNCDRKAGQILRDLHQGDHDPTIAKHLHLCALTTQFLCCAFLSYCRAHTGPFKPFFLDSGQHEIRLYGTQPFSDDAAITVKLAELPYLSDLIKGQALYFSSATKDFESPTRAEHSFDMLTTGVEFVDTWGPGYVLRGGTIPNEVHAIAIGPGYIARCEKYVSELRWTTGEPSKNILQFPFDPMKSMRISHSHSLGSLEPQLPNTNMAMRQQ